ncbi:ThuA domain-containing protein [Cohnella hashimotonis]|uniref:ThuA domain-containing protein n=1 Tax=Cohnella hashimotonis TaxID=2826895 RepID=A0ABT6TPM5_9BACL|nr:ThuA domain-containing protein [Cohnella hashimotonis]MDI4647772.1 ThuA domain-containing protein [Cohnella hashimotonis]
MGETRETTGKTREPIKVTVWNEYRHELDKPNVRAIYPQGMHRAIAEGLEGNFAIRTATLDEPEHGLGEAVLADTDVLVWWGHVAHKEVRDDIVDRVAARVLQGMGLIALHSAHYSKVFRKLMGTTCSLLYRDEGERERLWVTAPGHPIAEGVGPYFELEREEMYGEFFDIPSPDEVVFTSWYEGGNVFRSGCCFNRGQGKIFYFQPGHELYPTYHDANVLRVISNAVHWAAPTKREPLRFGKAVPALEAIRPKGAVEA